MLIVALVLAVIGLTALVTAVVTSNEVVAWVCIAASSIGVILLVVDAVRERQQRRTGYLTAGSGRTTEFVEYDDESGTSEAAVSEAAESIDETADETADEMGAETGADLTEETAQEAYPDEVVHDEPEYDTYSDDEPDYPESAEEAAMHTDFDSDSGPDGTSPAGR